MIIVIGIYVYAQPNNGMVNMILVAWCVTSVKINNGLRKVDFLGMMIIKV